MGRDEPVLEPLMGRVTSKTSRGLTIIELMIVVAIVAVILSLAAPSFKRTIEIQRLRGIHDQAMTDLQLARSEAVRSGQYVSFRMLEASAAGPACYIIYRDPTPDDAPCTCQEASGAPRCTGATTEIKTVKVDPALGVTFANISISGIRYRRLIFDPVTGGTYTAPQDSGNLTPTGLNFTTKIGDALALQGQVVQSGRPSTCVPSGSTVVATAC